MNPVTVNSECSGLVLNAAAHVSRGVVGVMLTPFSYALFCNFHANLESRNDFSNKAFYLNQRLFLNCKQPFPLHKLLLHIIAGFCVRRFDWPRQRTLKEFVNKVRGCHFFSVNFNANLFEPLKPKI